MLDSRVNTQLVELSPKFVALIGTDALRCPKDGKDVRLEPLSYGGRGAWFNTPQQEKFGELTLAHYELTNTQLGG